ncbi:MAG: DUF1203 domain-containing protein [Pseudomonadota bacterium]
MAFQFHALDAADFTDWFSMDEAALATRGAARVLVEKCPDIPCRVSLEDAAVGERVLAVNYTHQTANTPYRASHAIFVREGVQTAQLAANEVPALLRHRLLSLRAFNASGTMIDAEAVEGTAVEAELNRMFDNANVEDIHVHFAKPGCFAARVTRV